MAENIHNDIDKLFHDSIEPLGVLPGKHVWNNIEQELDKNNAEKYRRKYIIFKRTAGILLLLLLMFGVFNVINYHNSQNVTKSIIKNDARGNINSSINKNKGGPNYQNGYITSQFLNNKNKRSRIIGTRQIAEIKNGNSAEQSLSRGEDSQLPSVVNSPQIFALAIPGKFNDIALSVLPALQLLTSGIKDSGKIGINHSSKQPGKKNDKILSRFFVTVFAAPEYANYTLEDDETNHYENKDVIQKRERHLFSYSAGLLISYNVNAKFALQSGLTYSSSNINIDPNKIYAVKANSGDVKFRYNTSSGYGYILPSFSTSPAIGDSLYTRTSVHTLQFISIPFVVKYKFAIKKFSLEPGIGIAFNFLTKARLTTEVNDDTNSESEVITKLNGLKNINYSFLFSSEVQYHASKKWSFVAIPYFKHALAPINRGGVVKTYTYNIGLAIGLKHKL